ncbi:MAG: GDSL-type esterase/lipase family protein, partial [Prevotella sp.]|nr:GDSL-type esterase/lipase family protein [Prevotella sp.]
AQMQQILGEDYHVRNFGVGARTMLNKGDHPYMKELAWRDALAFNPDIVVIKLGTNDSKTANWKYSAEFEGDMQQMVDSLKALPSKPRIFLATPIPAFKTQWTINDSTIVNGVIPIIYKVAKNNALEVIDLHTAFNNNDGKQIQRDMIHPTKEGARQMATIVAAEITKPLPQPKGKKARQRRLKK